MDVTPTIRTSRKDARIAQTDTISRLLAKIVREVASDVGASSYADLKPEIRRRLNALRLKYRQCDLDRAINLVAAGGALLRRDALVGGRHGGKSLPLDVPPVTAGDASRMLALIAERTGRKVQIR